VPILLGSFISSSFVPACSSQMFVTVPERVAWRVMRPRTARYGESKAANSNPRTRGRGDHGQNSPWCTKYPNSRGDILTRRATALFSDSSVEIVLCRHKLNPRLVCRPPAAASSSPLPPALHRRPPTHTARGPLLDADSDSDDAINMPQNRPNVRHDELYLITHVEWKPMAEARHAALIAAMPEKLDQALTAMLQARPGAGNVS